MIWITNGVAFQWEVPHWLPDGGQRFSDRCPRFLVSKLVCASRQGTTISNLGQCFNSPTPCWLFANTNSVDMAPMKLTSPVPCRPDSWSYRAILLFEPSYLRSESQPFPEHKLWTSSWFEAWSSEYHWHILPIKPPFASVVHPGHAWPWHPVQPDIS